MQVVRTVTAAALGEALHGRQRQRRHRHQVGFHAGVDHPAKLGPVEAVVLGALVSDDQQVAPDQRHHRVAETVVRRRVFPVGNHLRLGLVGNIEDQRSAVEVGHVGAVRMLRQDVDVVRTVAAVEFGVTRGRRRRVALVRAGIPPAADFGRLRWIAHVDDAVELEVIRMRRLEITRARGQVHVLAVDEPHAMRAARMRTGGVEMRNQFRLLRRADVEQVHTGGLVADFLGLVGHGHDVAHDVQRIRAHAPMRQVGLHDDFRVLRIGNVDTVKFFGADSCASHSMRRPSLVICMLMPSPMPPNPASSLWDTSFMLREMVCAAWLCGDMVGFIASFSFWLKWF